MTEINFLPERFVRERARQRRVLRQWMMLLLVAGAMVTWFLMQQGRTHTLELYAVALDGEVEAAKRQNTELVKLRARFTALTNQLRIQRELAVPLTQTAVVATIGQLMPRAMTLTGLAVQLKEEERRSDRDKAGRHPALNAGNAAPTPKVRRLDIALQGVAPTDQEVADFIGALAEHRLFEQVKMKFSRAATVGKLIAREFRIEMSVPLEREFRSVQQASAAPEGEVSDAP